MTITAPAELAIRALMEASIDYESPVLRVGELIHDEIYGHQRLHTIESRATIRLLSVLVRLAREHDAWCHVEAMRGLSSPEASRAKNVRTEMAELAGSLPNSPGGFPLVVQIASDPRYATATISAGDYTIELTGDLPTGWHEQ